MAASDFWMNEDSYAYNGGLVEVNAKDLPLLGQTHVGVLDQHVAGEEEEYSSSSSLIQAGLVNGLLDGTSLKVVGNEIETTDAGWLKTNTGLGLELGLPILDTVTVEVLKTQQLIPFAPGEENGTIPDGEATGDDPTIPGEEPNNSGTDKPDEPTNSGSGPTNPGEEPNNPGNDTNPGGDLINPGNGTTNPGEESNNPGNGMTNSGEESTNPGNDPTTPGEEPTNPGSSTTNPGSVPTNPGESSANPGDSATNGNGMNPPYTGSDSSTDGTFEVTDENENVMPPLAAGSGGGSSDGPDSAVGEDEQADHSAEGGEDAHVTDDASLNIAGQKKTNGVAGNMAITTLNDSESRTSLPTTGGVWDANRLAIVAGLLLLSGLLLMLFGIGKIRLGRKSAS
ncbi:hypothetical protein NCCP2222_35730 [Sporosarcina sp. NCCP-2222]|nr:hypothetical protein NCCP2222_35730 [Sporosarcina sp. NCCP-2222]